ncbi:hypothetical protein [Alloactinosynnema sp. L-07]|nr:hypothetical protein [Alloactinosynnema sp. L-07]
MVGGYRGAPPEDVAYLFHPFAKIVRMGAGGGILVVSDPREVSVERPHRR